jgi:protein-tyrosine phosphatase
VNVAAADTPRPNRPEADLHCHILPAWDDGASTLDEALRMAARASESGIQKILVTPHVERSFGSRPERPARDIPSATAELQREIDARGIAMSLVPGAEITLTSADLPERIAREPWLTFGTQNAGGKGRYVLLEMPMSHWPNFVEPVLFQLSLQGITPIIAHPERLREVRQAPGMMQGIVNRGVLLQITARTLLAADTDRDERASTKCSRSLLEAGLVSIVASDAHSSTAVLPGDVAAVVASLVGEESAWKILVDNPRRILAGKPVPKISPATSKTGRRSIWSVKRLFGSSKARD